MSLAGALDTTTRQSVSARGKRLVVVSPLSFTKRTIFRNNVIGSHLSGLTFASPGRLPFAVVFNHARTHKEIKLQHVWVAVQQVTGSTTVVLDLVRLASVFVDLTNSPQIAPVFLTSNNPIIIPPAGNENLLDPIFPYKPGQTFQEAGVVGSTEFNLGTTAAGGTVNPPPDLAWRDLLQPTGASGNFTAGTLTLPRGQDGGFAVMIDSSAAVSVLVGCNFDIVENEVF